MSTYSCKHPLKAFPIGLTDKGKTKYKITSYDVQYVFSNRLENVKEPGKRHWYTCTDEFYDIKQNHKLISYSGATILKYDYVTDFIEIPCGHCIACRLKYSREWANRCMLEAQQYEHNYFVTLTYNDEHLPDPNDCPPDPETGEIHKSPVHPLVKRDIQLFMKRLRKRLPDQKIRYFGCGEYGSAINSMRPHYHLILFNCDLGALLFKKKNAQGDNYYLSKVIAECWCDPSAPKVWSDTYKCMMRPELGYHVVTDCTWSTCAYTARYVTKKLQGEESNIYVDYAYPREFSLCSRKPGIARDYFDNHKDSIYENEEIIIPLGKDGARIVRPPKYYDRLYDIEYPEEFSEIREKRRKIAEANNKLKSSLTSLEYLQQLEVEEYNLSEKIKSLKRDRIL